MGYSLEVYDHNFEEEVLEKSRQTPVIVDFYATWCGPCQMLAPILKQVAQEYDCVVAKVNTDENPYIPQAYGVQGIPDVKIFRDGEVIDGFVGVLPEPELRNLLAKCQIRSDLDDRMDAVKQAMDSGDSEAAESQLLALCEAYPDRPQLFLDAAKFYVAIGEFEKAEARLAEVPASDRQYAPQVEAVRALITFKRQCDRPVGESELDREFSRACCLTVSGNYKEALETFIDLVGRDRGYQNDGARKAAIAIFNLLGNDHPLTQEYRRQLTMALY
ncbi:thioredoxin [Baaleninema simplex]|uniref:thioredoxin n=1 Tax=Baaleninema simplex TaxID=2862350 RepID=UPI00034B6FAE|nr:thioredoxin [Baaleninema simplex]